jgi:hypothetical protein
MDYYIDFTTVAGDEPNTVKAIDAVKVNISMVRITDMDKPMSINLCDHPLYEELEKYVLANRRRSGTHAR